AFARVFKIFPDATFADARHFAAVARDEMACVSERCVRKDLEHSGERLAHTLAPRVPRAADFWAGGALEDAVVGHEGHQDVDIVTVPAAAKERFQVLDRHHGLLAREDLPEEALSQFPIHPRGR